MIAAKMLDQVMGIDVHIVQPPGPVPPVPLPHPFIGMVLDVAEYLPWIGASVWVNGQPRAQAGNEAKNIPHFPLGGTFIKPIGNEGEVFTGSATVNVEDEPFSRMGSVVLSCSCIGIPGPPRADKPAKAGMKLPTSVLIAIPTGQPVLVGGPPTISLRTLATKAAFAAAGGLFNKFVKNEQWYLDWCTRVHERASRYTQFLPGNWMNKVHKKICDTIGHPVDVATGKVFTDRVDFALPGPLPLEWERTWYSVSDYAGPLGHGWHFAYDLSLGLSDNGSLHLRLPDGRNAYVPYLYPGDEVYLRQEQLRFTHDGEFIRVTDAAYRVHLFPAAELSAATRSPLARIERAGVGEITFRYREGSLSELTDSAGRTLHFTTDGRGRITAVEAPHPSEPGRLARLVTYRYDEHGDLVQSTDALGNSFHYVYEDHLLVKETDRNGLSFYFEYDDGQDIRRCLRTWGDGGIHDNTVAYDPERQTSAVTNSRGELTVYHWNDDGLVWKITDPLGNESRRQFAADGNLLRRIDELGRVTSYEYDRLGHPRLIRYPDGTTTELSRADHLLVAGKDQNGGAWSWVYDAHHRLTARTDCTGATTAYAYRENDLVSITDPLGAVTRLSYDTAHNLTELTAPNGVKHRWVYDGLGRIIRSYDPRGNMRRVELDLLGNVLRAEEPDGNVRTLSYDAEENVLHARDKQHDVRFEYVGMSRLAARIEAGVRVEFDYDSEEDLVGIRNEHGHAYRFGLDACGRVVRETSFDGITKRYERDAAGQVSAIVRPGDRRSDYTYDRMGRVERVDYHDGTTVDYGYRADGELTLARNGAVKLEFERDPLGRVLKERQGGFEIDSSYDRVGRRVSITSSLGAAVNIHRNRMGDVTGVEGTTKELDDPWSVHFERDQVGLELERTLPGGVKSRWQRDHLGRPVRQETTVGARRTRGQTYRWGLNDRLHELLDDTGGRFAFEHDVFGNLSSATYPDGTEEFRMPDAMGNLFRTRNRKDRKYNPAGQLLVADGTKFTYDAEGNRTEKREKNGDRWRYEWTAAGMLKRVHRPDGEAVVFTYDALGRRLAKSYRGQLTRWVWDGNVPLHEWQEQLPRPASAAERKTALPLSPTVNGELATWLFEPGTFAPLAKFTPHNQYGIVTDHLGTPVTMYTAEGKKVWSLELSIYGEVRRLDGWKGVCPFRYPGQYHDDETGLVLQSLSVLRSGGGGLPEC